MIVLNKYLKNKDFIRLTENKETIEIHEALKSAVENNHQFLTEFSADKVIYGVNTGFGPMAQFRVSDENRLKLQYNLIRSHASGTGKVMPEEHIRATMIARLNSLAQVKSGVHPSVIELLAELINKEIYPVIFEHGGVGASGDLVQLAHVALVLIGEGEVIYQGERQATKDVFEKENLKPITIAVREGLALINGTSAMTGIGLMNHHKAERLLNWSISCSALINEIVEAYDDHFSEELNGAKKHKGQAKIAEIVREHLQDSKRTKKRDQHLYNGKNQEKVFKEKVQEYYSIRCIPQILGPIYDTLNYVGEVLENELNSANDNPIIDSEKGQVYHGGNFHGDYVSLEMDKLKLVVTRMTMLAERQLNYLVNSKINEILPPFVNRGVLGLNYGVQAAQFTATSTTAENQMLSNSMYVHSIPCNNDNQDIVSMGTNAAQIASTTIENAFEVLSIEMITLYQAVKHLDILESLSSKSKEIIVKLGAVIPDIIEDNPLYPVIERTKQYLKTTNS
ncbi:MAG TPA: aromatic amino acid ammonia-lyase [Brumimicrobium sp.]|nr:aromatic amino acid ammonia-lyase [Brumimicrobium sp.]